MIELKNDELLVSFPEVHPMARLRIGFQRTLRIPDDNQDYPLPAGLGLFPLHHVDDHGTPEHWRQRGGVFLPIHQSEALWINFSSGSAEYPMAVKVAAGKINAVTGKPWHNELTRDPQDYLPVPRQPWLDGFNVGKDIVRQFVAMPLGRGVTAEEQITGEATWGGLQIIVYPMSAEEFERRREMAAKRKLVRAHGRAPLAMVAESEMGAAPGGRIRQTIRKDIYGFDHWDTSVHSRCFVHLLNAQAYRDVTGKAPPPTPITPETYQSQGIPWFDHYGEGPDVDGSTELAQLDGLASALAKKGDDLDNNTPIQIAQTVKLGHPDRKIRDGVF